MSEIDKIKVDQALEIICQTGCGQVRSFIQELEEGRIPRAARALNHEEQALLLIELNEVMNAYQQTCPT